MQIIREVKGFAYNFNISPGHSLGSHILSPSPHQSFGDTIGHILQLSYSADASIGECLLHSPVNG